MSSRAAPARAASHSRTPTIAPIRQPLACSSCWVRGRQQHRLAHRGRQGVLLRVGVRRALLGALGQAAAQLLGAVVDLAALRAQGVAARGERAGGLVGLGRAAGELTGRGVDRRGAGRRRRRARGEGAGAAARAPRVAPSTSRAPRRARGRAAASARAPSASASAPAATPPVPRATTRVPTATARARAWASRSAAQNSAEPPAWRHRSLSCATSPARLPVAVESRSAPFATAAAPREALPHPVGVVARRRPASRAASPARRPEAGAEPRTPAARSRLPCGDLLAAADSDAVPVFRADGTAGDLAVAPASWSAPWSSWLAPWRRGLRCRRPAAARWRRRSAGRWRSG